MCVSIIGIFFQNVQSQQNTFPDCVMLTIPGDPATSRAVTWRTDYEDSISIGEITLADAAPILDKNKLSLKGTSSPWEEGSMQFRGHRIIFNNLIPDSQYAYRVGNGKNWSEWYHFKTSSEKANSFSFLYFGDVQNNIKSYGSRILRRAYTHFPDADFLLFVGDLVNRSKVNMWDQFFYAGGWMFGTTPSLVTPGNHEYDKGQDNARMFSKHWKQIFTMPENSPSEEFDDRVYYMDYQGTRFISIDSPALVYDDQDRKLILNWLEEVLSGNPHPWTVVFTHYPVYSCSQRRGHKMDYIRAVKPLFEEYGVDVILQGHDHTYCRGQNLSMAGTGPGNKPVYVVSVAGPKMYGLGTNFWSDRVASNTQLYQHICFSGDTMSYTSYTVTGELYDAFRLVKDQNGMNTFLESGKIDVIDQRTEIPENAKRRYSEEDLKKYNERYSK